jgi:hypothetical protein
MLHPLLKASLFLLFTSTAFALEPGDQEALKDTQRLLADPAALQQFAKDHQDANQAMQQISEITKGNEQQSGELSAISSRVFADIVKESNGDSATMQMKLQMALKDPAAFMRTLSPEQRARIVNLTSELQRNEANKRVPAGISVK